MSAPSLKRFRVLYRQESRYKAWVSAASEDAAIAFVEDALDNGHDLDATVYDGENEVVCAIEIDEGGAP